VHCTPQEPPLQTGVEPMHALPQLPQLVLLEFVFTQLPMPKPPPPKKPRRPWVHCVSPVGHVHVPFTQARPPGQTVPHEPQLRLLVCKLAQVVLLPKNVMVVQEVVPPGQPPHDPFVHC
jgi:hypothetical protein